MNKKNLLKQAKELFNKHQFQDVIYILSDEIIDKERLESLYLLRGWAHNNLDQSEQGLHYATKALNLNSNYGPAYRVRGTSLLMQQLNDKAIADFTKAIELDNKDINSYYNRAVAWYNKNSFDKAIEDYNTTAILDPNDSMIYYNRGSAWREKGDLDKAILDYTEAIKLNPQYAKAYANRGLIWYKTKQYKNAKDDYDKALDLEKKDPTIYKNRGIVNEIVFKDYQNALNDYNEAIFLNIDDKSTTIYWRDALLEKIKEQENIQRIVSFTNDLSLSELTKKLEAAVIEILKFAISGKREATVHYTKLFVADKLVNPQNDIHPDLRGRLRYYNAIYMNDPSEGDSIFECFSNQNLIRIAFSKGKKTKESSVYLGSFLANNDSDLHEDELVMWRTYGKDEKQVEAAGCSLIIKDNFFDKHVEERLMEQTSGEQNIQDGVMVSQGLYQVIYFKAGQYHINDVDEIERRMASLELIIMELLSLQEKITEDDDKKTVDEIIFDRLSRICYLFKSSDYDFEHEVRVIQYMPRGTELIQVDEGFPPKLYISSNKPILPYLEKIFIGSKVDNPDNWMAYLDYRIKERSRLDRSEYNVVVHKSTCKFR